MVQVATWEPVPWGDPVEAWGVALWVALVEAPRKDTKVTIDGSGPGEDLRGLCRH